AEERAELGAGRLRLADELAAGAPRKPAKLDRRLVGMEEALEGAPLLVRHVVAAAEKQDRCELHEPARIDEVGEPPQANAVAQRPPPPAQALAERRHGVGLGVPQDGRAV